MFIIARSTLRLFYCYIVCVGLILVGTLYYTYNAFLYTQKQVVMIKALYEDCVQTLQKTIHESASLDIFIDNRPEKETDDVCVPEESDVLSFDLDITFDQKNKADPFEVSTFQSLTREEEKRLQEYKTRAFKEPINFVKPRKKKQFFKSKKQMQQKKHEAMFQWPIELSKFWLSSLYGPRRTAQGKMSFHYAIDMASVRGTPVTAAASGTVLCAQSLAGYGNYVDIYHNKHFKTRYAHLDTIKVRVGDKVMAGELIGTVGSTGFIRKMGKDGSHLHFEVHHDGKKVNPLSYLM